MSGQRRRENPRSETEGISSEKGRVMEGHMRNFKQHMSGQRRRENPRSETEGIFSEKGRVMEGHMRNFKTAYVRTAPQRKSQE